jgi:DNA-binding response OmpR family regulator
MPDRLLLLVVGPLAQAAGLTEHLTDPSLDIRVCVDVAEAVRVLHMVGPVPVEAPAPSARRPVRAGALRLDPAAQEAELHGRRIALPPRETRLLHLLMTNANHVVSREEIQETVWGAGERPSNTITVHIQRLRSRLGEDPEIIQTVRRLGYRLVPPPRRAKAG